MGQQTINTFSKGMIQDFDKSVQPEGSYLEANNFRLVTSEGGTSASLENINGNKQILDFVVDQTDLYYVGHAFIRDELYVLLTNCVWGDHTMGTKDAIVKFDIDFVTEISTRTDLWISSGELTLSINDTCKVIGRYENEDVKKLYWVDGYNNIRYANVGNYLTTDGLIKSDSNTYLPVDKFEFLSNVSLDAPLLNDIKTGNLYSGKIQYAYQLYKPYGSETTYSPLSGLFNVVTKSDFLTDSDTYKGELSSIDTGKGFELQITITGNDGFNRCRIVAIQYTSLNTIPIIRIAGELDIEETGGVFIFTDIGVNLGEYTLEEFAILGTSLFKAEDLEVKDNILFAANIEEEYFDIETYDARAYRFDAGGVVKIYESDDTYYQIYKTGVFSSIIPGGGGATLGDWEYFGTTNYGTDDTSAGANTLTDSTQTWTTDELAGYTVYNVNDSTSDTVASNTGTVITFDNPGTTVWTAAEIYFIADDDVWNGDTWTVPETADCINKYNDLDNDAGATELYHYKDNTDDLGAIGLNVEIMFETDIIIIDDDNAVDDLTVSIETVADNKSYTSHASPWLSGNKLSWQRDEVYRIGLQFIDNKSRYSYIKWICDLRMPRHRIYPAATGNFDGTLFTYVGGTRTEAYPLYPKFRLINALPSGAEGYRLVRSKRDSTVNRNILASGITAGMRTTIRPDLYGTGGGITIDSAFRFFSPEVSFNRNLELRHNDSLHYVNVFDNTQQGGAGYGGGNADKLFKQRGLTVTTAAITAVANDYSDIDDMIFTLPSKGAVYYNSLGYINHIDSGVFANDDSWGGTCMVVKNTNGTWTPPTVQYGCCNYRRNNFGSQYGGHTYEERKYSTYVECSDLATAISGDYTTAYRGDTFLSFFDALTLIFDLDYDYTVGAEATQEVVYFPIETSINLELRHDDCHHRVSSVEHHELLREFAGTHTDDGGNEYKQITDLYQYNSVYSQDITTKIYQSVPLGFNSIEEFDTRVKSSNIKINGEALDSWTKFGANEYIDVDSKYGPINDLTIFKDRLMYFQDHGFGTLSVNPRSLISDNNPGALVLGTGDLLDRFDYMSTSVGNKHKFGIVNSSNSLYWFYDNERALYQFSGSDMPISKLKGMQSWFDKAFVNGMQINGIYDNKFNEAIFTIDHVEIDTWTVLTKDQEGADPTGLIRGQSMGPCLWQENDITYGVYVKKWETPTEAEPMVFSYNHVTKQMSDQYELGITSIAADIDPHAFPGIMVAGDGHILIYHEAHYPVGQHNREVQIKRSDNTYDITSWVNAKAGTTDYYMTVGNNSTERLAYYQMIKMSNDDLYLMCREYVGGGRYIRIYKSVDHGLNWDAGYQIVDTGGSDWFYFTVINHSVTENTIRIFVAKQERITDDKRYVRIFYLESTDGENWHDVNNDHTQDITAVGPITLATLEDTATNKYQIDTTESKTSHLNRVGGFVDSNDNIIVYATYHEIGDKYIVKAWTFDGTDWVNKGFISDDEFVFFPVFTKSGRNYYMLAAVDDDTIRTFNLYISKDGLEYTKIKKLVEIPSPVENRDGYYDIGFLGNGEDCDYILGYSHINTPDYTDLFFVEINALKAKTIAYSETLDSFSTLYDFPIDHYVGLYNDRFLSIKSNETNAWLHDSESVDKNSLYGIVEDSTIKLIINDNYSYIKVFDNIAYVSNVTDAGLNIFSDTFTDFRAWNDYQNTDWVTLTPDDNIKRREREWTMAIPRNVVDTDVSSNPDIFDVANLDSTQKFKSRMRDQFIVLEFKYDNSNNYKFSIPYIKTSYRVSHR